MVTNVGDAEIEGLSLDFSAFLWDSLDFGFNLQLLDPRDRRRTNSISGREAGDRLPFSAEEKGAALARVHLSRASSRAATSTAATSGPTRAIR